MPHLHVFFSIIGLAVNVICQVYYCRHIRAASLLRSAFFGFFCGIVSLLCLEIYYFRQVGFIFSAGAALAAADIISYIALGYCYFHFINLGETARRVRLLRELIDAPEGLSLEEILRRYNAREIIDNRLNRLMKNGQILYRNNRYYIGNPFMLTASKMVTGFKSLILGKITEFD